MQCPEPSCQASASAGTGAACELQPGTPVPKMALDAMDQQERAAAELAKLKGKGKLLEIQEAPPEPAADEEVKPAPEPEPAGVEIDDLTCAICLEQMKMADTAIIKGCEHSYCATCILSWKVVKEQAGCPQCKAPFSTLYTYRSLDGTLHDFPQEESVCLLARAQWFAAHLKEAEKGKQAMAEVLGQRPTPSGCTRDGDWNDYSRYFEEYDDDEEVENYYFSAAAGRARIVLGNRRWGENGYVSSGRQHARPRVNQTTGKGKGKGSSSKGKAAVAASPSTASQPTPAQPTAAQRRIPSASSPVSIPQAQTSMNGAAYSEAQKDASPCTPVGQHMRGRRGQQMTDPGAADAAFGSSPGSDCGGSNGQGRRARRAAKKAAADARNLANIPGF